MVRRLERLTCEDRLRELGLFQSAAVGLEVDGLEATFQPNSFSDSLTLGFGFPRMCHACFA